jgi:hypothetical protein
MGIFFPKSYMFLYKKYLTNQGYYAYLTNGDMCDRGICGIWGYGMWGK